MKLKILNLTSGFILLSILAACWITAGIIEPFLYYHFQQTGFLTTYEFFHSYAVQAGGMSDYIAEFIAQFFYFNMWGSMLIVAVAALQGFIALDLIARLTGKTKFTFSIFASLLLLGVIVLFDYRYPYYASIRLLFAYLFTYGYYFFFSKYKRISLYGWPAFAILLFYLGSGPALFVFTACTLLIIAAKEKSTIRVIVIPAFIAFAAILPYIGFKFLFQTTLPNLYRLSVVKPPQMLAYSTFYQLAVYYALLPLMMLTFLFFFRKREETPVTGEKKGKKTEKKSLLHQPIFLLTVQLAVLTGVGYFLFVKSFDPLKKNLLRIEYYAEAEDWQKVLKVAEDIDHYDFKVNFQVNRAYAHLGQLPERLFAYPQVLGVNGVFFDNSNINGSFTMPNSDLYYDLGFMSESQRWAFEGQTLMPNSPRILKRLIMINLVNREYQLAQEFLDVLDRNMLYHDWVADHRKFVADTTLTNNDPEIVMKRKCNPHQRYVHLDPLDDLKLLFETYPKNKFAYDYLLTVCILTTDFDDFMKYLPYYTTFNIRTLPRSWAEALSIYIIRNKTIPSFMTEETVSKDVMKRMMQFNKTTKQYHNDLKAAQPALRAGFEDTYWYYMLYLDPKVTKVLTHKAEVL
jgi:hypothetical protein